MQMSPRQVAAAAVFGLALTGLAPAAPSQAQTLNDVGRVLQGTLLNGSGRNDEGAQRRAYEQGRRDEELRNRNDRGSHEAERRRDDGHDRADRGRDDRSYGRNDHGPAARGERDDRFRHDDHNEANPGRGGYVRSDRN